MRRSEAEDAGGLTPVKDDNEAAPHFPRRTLLVFNCFDDKIRASPRQKAKPLCFIPPSESPAPGRDPFPSARGRPGAPVPQARGWSGCIK